MLVEKNKYEPSRAVFYSQINGLLLVHDLMNKNSYKNLKKWIVELVVKLSTTAESYRWKENLQQIEQQLDLIQTEQLTELELPNGGGTLPVLIIGNKDDLVDKVFKEQHRQVMAEEDGNNLYISSHNPSTFAPGSYASQKVNAFFNKLIYRKFYDSQNLNSRIGLDSPHSLRSTPKYSTATSWTKEIDTPALSEDPLNSSFTHEW